MNRHKTFFTAVTTIVFLPLLLFNLVNAKADDTKLTIVYAAAMSEIYQDSSRGGLPQLKTVLDTIRETNANTLFIHGGSALAPGMLSTIDKGAHMIALLNLLRPDALAVARCEFAHQEDELSRRTYEAAFPFVSSNTFDPATGKAIEGVYSHLLIPVGNLNIGLLSVVNPDVLQDYITKRIQLLNISEAIDRNSGTLRQMGADLVILTGDFSIEEFNQYFSNPPVDIVLLNRETGTPKLTQRGNGFFELRGHAGYAGVIELNIHGDTENKSLSSTSKLIDLIEYLPDETVSNAIRSYLTQLTDQLNVRIGVTHTRLDTRRTAVRTEENAFANLVTDTLREFYHSEISLINGGAIRGDKLYPAGSALTWGDIEKELPYNNRVINLKLKGQFIIAALENGLGHIEEIKGGFPHISGMEVEYNPGNLPGQRVLSVTLNDQPLDPEKFYTLTTIDFLANGGDGYSSLKNAERIVKIGETRLLWEYVKNRIVDDGEISPIIDGRMKAVK